MHVALHLYVFEQEFGTEANISLSQVITVLRSKRRYDWEAWLLGQKLPLTIGLLAQGADIHANGDRALWWAIQSGSARIIRFLLDNGVEGRQFLEKAKSWGYFREVEIIKDWLAKEKAGLNQNETEKEQ